MDRRSKILVGLIGVLGAYGLFQRVVFPYWIEPVLTIDERIAARQGDLAKLEELFDNARKAKSKYRELMARNGSSDVGRIETDVRDRLNQLIEKHKLQNMQVTRTKPARVGKTDLKRMRIVVKAVGSLQAAVEFLRDVSELPQLLRVENARIYPSGSGRTRLRAKQMNLTVPLDVWILPQQKIVGRIDEKSLTSPALVVRHADRDYSTIWEGKPFSEYVPPVPLVVRTGSAVNVVPRKRVTLTGSASGGEPPYTFQWSPTEGLSSPTKGRTRVETSKPFERAYTLTVKDVNGKTASSTVRVTVKERPKPTKIVKATKPPRPTPKPKPVDLRWKDRKYMQLRMALLRSHGTERLDEVMVYNKKKKQAAYYAVGDEFDGGRLVFVHPTGGVVRRTGEYFLYPIGTWLDGDLRADDTLAGEYPTLQRAVARSRQADEEKARREKEAADAKAALEATTASKRETPASQGAGAGRDAANTALTKAGLRQTDKTDNKNAVKTPRAVPGETAGKAPAKTAAKKKVSKPAVSPPKKIKKPGVSGRRQAARRRPKVRRPPTVRPRVVRRKTKRSPSGRTPHSPVGKSGATTVRSSKGKKKPQTKRSERKP